MKCGRNMNFSRLGVVSFASMNSLYHISVIRVTRKPVGTKRLRIHFSSVEMRRFFAATPCKRMYKIMGMEVTQTGVIITYHETEFAPSSLCAARNRNT